MESWRILLLIILIINEKEEIEMERLGKSRRKRKVHNLCIISHLSANVHIAYMSVYTYNLLTLKINKIVIQENLHNRSRE